MDHVLNPKVEKQVIYEIYKACRLCGAGAGYKMPIIQNVVDLDDQEVQLKQKIRECVQIEVHQNDKMPPLICELCVDKVNDFYEFFDMCRQTNKRTRLRLGLPPQSLPKGAPDTGDCILGVTEPVYVNSDSESEPLSKQKRSQPPQKIKKKEPELRVKVENYIPKQESRSTRFKTKRPRTPPRVTRHSKPSTDADDVVLSSLVDKQKSSKLQPKSILKKEVKSEDTSLLVPRLKRPRDREPVVKIEVPSKKVKIAVKALSSRIPPRPARPPPRPTRSHPHPTRSSDHPNRSTAHPTRSPSHPTRSPGHPTRSAYPTRSPAHPSRSPSHPTKSPSHPAKSPSHPAKSPSQRPRSPAPPSRPLRSPAPSPSPRAPAPSSSPRPPARQPSPPRDLTCEICSQVSKAPQGYYSHMRIHNVGYTSSKMACNACAQWFTTAEESEAHHNWHKTKSEPYTCRRCTADFKYEQAYDEHFDKNQCIPWDIVPDVKCDQCWHKFPTNNLLENHACGGRDARPGGNCPKCNRSYVLLKSLQRHEKFCTAKRKGGSEPIVDPELLGQLKPIQVRVARCDPLLSNIKQEHYDVSSVATDFGLDRKCVYPYISSVSSLRIKSEPEEFDSMVSIKQEIKDEFCTEKNYVHWDSDSETDSEPEVTGVMLNPFAKKRRIDSLTSLALKTIFSKRFLGKVPKKLRRIKMEHGFDALLASKDNDESVRKEIADIINNLGNDDDLNDSQEDDKDTAKEIGNDVIKSVNSGSNEAVNKDNSDSIKTVSSNVVDVNNETLNDSKDTSKSGAKGESKDISMYNDEGDEKNDGLSKKDDESVSHGVKLDSTDKKDSNNISKNSKMDDTDDVIDGVSRDVPKDQCMNTTIGNVGIDANCNDKTNIAISDHSSTEKMEGATKDETNDGKNDSNISNKLNENISTSDEKRPQAIDSSKEVTNGKLDLSNDKSLKSNNAETVIKFNDKHSHSTVNVEDINNLSNVKKDNIIDNDRVCNDKNVQSENILNSNIESELGQNRISNDMMDIVNDSTTTVSGHNDVVCNVNANEENESSIKEINDNLISGADNLSSNKNPSAVKMLVGEDVRSMDEDRRLMEAIDAQLGENSGNDEFNDKKDISNDNLSNDRGKHKMLDDVDAKKHNESFWV